MILDWLFGSKEKKQSRQTWEDIEESIWEDEEYEVLMDEEDEDELHF